MTNRKGPDWESAIRNTLNGFWRKRWGLKAYRPAQSGFLDEGDIHGVSPFVLQAKDDKSFRLSEWLDGKKGVTVQAQHADEPFGAVVVKRRRKPTAAAYVVQRLDDFARVLIRLRRAEALLETHAPEAFLRHAEETTQDYTTPMPSL